jgi:flagellar protein FliS
MALGSNRGYEVGAVATASPAGLVTILYDAALSSVGRAKQALGGLPGPEELDRANKELTKAQDIVLELQLSLDHVQGGQIAESLASLYEFCLDRLLRANLSKDPQPLSAVVSVLSQLREAWTEATHLAETA